MIDHRVCDQSWGYFFITSKISKGLSSGVGLLFSHNQAMIDHGLYDRSQGFYDPCCDRSWRRGLVLGRSKSLIVIDHGLCDGSQIVNSPYFTFVIDHGVYDQSQTVNFVYSLL